MYFLRFLKGELSGSDAIKIEHRLACSGEFYNRKVTTSDWRKSDITRILLDQPFLISVVSRPFNVYPQELCVRISVQSVTEEAGAPEMRSSMTFSPDDYIIEDLCSVLTLLSRRLVSPITKTREIHQGPYAAPCYGGDVPMPILDRAKIAVWPRRPGTVVTYPSGQSFKSNDPPPTGVDPDALSQFLTDLPNKPNAIELVHCARLYRSALELINDRPDTAYLALVSVAESLSALALADYEPDEQEKFANYYGALKKTARRLGLDDEKIKTLVLAACKHDRWLSKKFLKFCADYCPTTELRNPDRVFLMLEHLNPAESEIGEALHKIYVARSKLLHVGRPFPPGVGLGMQPTIDFRDLPLDPMGRPEIPTAPWFERIVSIAARKFMIGDNPTPFVDADD